MRVERVICGRDRRDTDAPVSAEARMLVWRMQAAGFVLELREGRVRVTSGERVSTVDRDELVRRFHDIRQLLTEERPQ